MVVVGSPEEVVVDLLKGLLANPSGVLQTRKVHDPRRAGGVGGHDQDSLRRSRGPLRSRVLGHGPGRETGVYQRHAPRLKGVAQAKRHPLGKGLIQ